MAERADQILCAFQALKLNLSPSNDVCQAHHSLSMSAGQNIPIAKCKTERSNGYSSWPPSRWWMWCDPRNCPGWRGRLAVWWDPRCGGDKRQLRDAFHNSPGVGEVLSWSPPICRETSTSRERYSPIHETEDVFVRSYFKYLSVSRIDALVHRLSFSLGHWSRWCIFSRGNQRRGAPWNLFSRSIFSFSSIF